MARFVLFLALAAAAAGVTGKWSGTYCESEPAYLIFTQDGNSLTGTAGHDESEQWPIQDAKIVEKTITGTVNPSEGAVYAIMATVDGDRMTGTVSITQQGQTEKCKMDLKRVQ